MTAAEKLRALDGRFELLRVGAVPPPVIELTFWPQIVAVVAAAEDGRDHSLLLSSEPAGVEMVGWAVAKAQALQSALAALDEQLGNDPL